eukprot:TRINITY_DN1498_c0_g1_i3.p1 TRINITY_DN1498_c0_g1~~TRINITY_DN1498_c0_g1_i3.p1  ORF type:complete len:916 (-),score=201.37 TRINITY_DN1498_c0_g1_i3:35-2692(-)
MDTISKSRKNSAMTVAVQIDEATTEEMSNQEDFSAFRSRRNIQLRPDMHNMETMVELLHHTDVMEEMFFKRGIFVLPTLFCYRGRTSIVWYSSKKKKCIIKSVKHTNFLNSVVDKLVSYSGVVVCCHNHSPAVEVEGFGKVKKEIVNFTSVLGDFREFHNHDVMLMMRPLIISPNPRQTILQCTHRRSTNTMLAELTSNDHSSLIRHDKNHRNFDRARVFDSQGIFRMPSEATDAMFWCLKNNFEPVKEVTLDFMQEATGRWVLMTFRNIVSSDSNKNSSPKAKRAFHHLQRALTGRQKSPLRAKRRSLSEPKRNDVDLNCKLTIQSLQNTTNRENALIAHQYHHKSPKSRKNSITGDSNYNYPTNSPTSPTTKATKRQFFNENNKSSSNNQDAKESNVSSTILSPRRVRMMGNSSVRMDNRPKLSSFGSNSAARFQEKVRQVREFTEQKAIESMYETERKRDYEARRSMILKKSPLRESIQSGRPGYLKGTIASHSRHAERLKTLSIDQLIKLHNEEVEKEEILSKTSIINVRDQISPQSPALIKHQSSKTSVPFQGINSRKGSYIEEPESSIPHLLKEIKRLSTPKEAKKREKFMQKKQIVDEHKEKMAVPPSVTQVLSETAGGLSEVDLRTRHSMLRESIASKHLQQSFLNKYGKQKLKRTPTSLSMSVKYTSDDFQVPKIEDKSNGDGNGDGEDGIFVGLDDFAVSVFSEPSREFDSPNRPRLSTASRPNNRSISPSPGQNGNNSSNNDSPINERLYRSSVHSHHVFNPSPTYSHRLNQFQKSPAKMSPIRNKNDKNFNDNNNSSDSNNDEIQGWDDFENGRNTENDDSNLFKKSIDKEFSIDERHSRRKSFSHVGSSKGRGTWYLKRDLIAPFCFVFLIN